MAEEKLKDIYPLTPVQEGMLFYHLYMPESQLYVEQLRVDFDGDLDVGAFFKAIRAVVDRHAALRTAFQWEGLKKPVQIELASVDVPLEHLDRGDDAPRRAELAESYADAERAKGFDLGKAPLLRVGILQFGSRDYHLVWTFHHLILDGWSLGIALGEIFAFYDHYRHGLTLSLATPLPFKNHLIWLKGRKEKEAAAFWKRRLADLERLTPLFGEQPSVPFEGRDRYRDSALVLGAEDTARLNAFAQACKATPNTVLQGILGLIMHSLVREEEIVFGSTVNGRPTGLPGFESMVGMFINTVPCRVSVRPSESFASYAQGIQASQAEQGPYEYYPLTAIQKELSFPVRSGAFFDTILVFENYPMDEGAFGRSDFAMRNLKTSERTNYPLTIVVSKSETLKMTFFHDAALVGEASLSYIMGAFRRVIQDLADPGRRLGDFQLLGEAEREAAIALARVSLAAPRAAATLVELFEASVARYAARPALVEGSTSLSYADFDAAANRLAHALRERGVGRGSIVGVRAERSSALVIALYAVLKAGGAYLPIDPSYPRDRVAFMLEDSGALLALHDNSSGVPLPSGFPALDLGDLSYLSRFPATAPARLNSPEDLAYIIYTSGSTGTPKGVMVEHRSAANILRYLDERYPLGQDDAFLLKTTFTFDVSVAELFGWFFGGGRLVLLERGAEKDPFAILRTIRDTGATHVNFVPSMLNLFVQAFAAGGPEAKGALDGLKYLLVAGEALSTDLVEACKRLGGGFRIENLYGPTEATIYATMASLSEGPAPSPVPIGRPVDTAIAYVLDPCARPLPPGLAGELCLGGPCLARGYLKRPELDAQRFVADPFAPGARMYRTGDLAAARSDGAIDYLGRIDFQVKIRGFRIELGEIESALRAHAEIGNALAIASIDRGGDASLCAYYAAQRELPAAELRAFLGKSLPEYMLPSYFIRMDALPLTASGKIDRAALPKPMAGASAPGYVPPRGALEEAISGIWVEVLGAQRIGSEDVFFEVGGDSLKAIKVVSRLKSLGHAVEIKDLFSFQTPAALARHLASLQQGEGTTPLAEVEGAIAERFGLQARYSAFRCEGRRRLLLSVQGEAPEGLADFLAETFSAACFPDRILGASMLPEPSEVELELDEAAYDAVAGLRALEVDYARLDAEVLAAEAANRAFVAGSERKDRFEISPIQYMQHRLPLRASGTILKLEGYALIQNIETVLLDFVNRHGQLRSVLGRSFLKLYWNEYGPLPSLPLARLDLTQQDAASKEAAISLLVNRYFKRPHRIASSFAYRLILVRLSLKEAYLCFPADHLIYERRCEDILKAHLERYSRGGTWIADSERAAQGEAPPYSEYVRTIYKGPTLSPEALIEGYGFRGFGRARLELEKAIKRRRNGEANILSRDIVLEGVVDEERAWRTSLVAIARFLSEELGMNALPIKMLIGARVLGERNYFNTFGEFVDVAPFLLEFDAAEPAKMLEAYKVCFERLSSERLNVLSILLDPRLRRRYRKALKFIMPQILSIFDSLLLFNFSGASNPLVERLLAQDDRKRIVAKLIKQASIYCGASYAGNTVTVTVYSAIPFDGASLERSAAFAAAWSKA